MLNFDEAKLRKDKIEIGLQHPTVHLDFLTQLDIHLREAGVGEDLRDLLGQQIDDPRAPLGVDHRFRAFRHESDGRANDFWCRTRAVRVRQ